MHYKVSALEVDSGSLCYLKQILLYFATLRTPQLIIYSADQQLFFFVRQNAKKYSAKYFGVATTICGAIFKMCCCTFGI
jgi:hypothetical protein